MKKMLWVWLALCILNAVATIGVLAAMPATELPIHFNLEGAADRYGSKWWNLLGAAVPLVLWVAYAIYRRVTRANPQIAANRALEDKLIPLTSLALALVGWIMLAQSLRDNGRMDIDAGCWILFALSLLLAIFSNFMGKIRQNRTFGYRLPWTLKDEQVWNRTHRVSGYAGMAGGVMGVIGALIGLFTGNVIVAFVFFFGGLLVLLLVPLVYARRLYYRLHPEEK